MLTERDRTTEPVSRDQTTESGSNGESANISCIKIEVIFRYAQLFEQSRWNIVTLYKDLKPFYAGHG